LIGGATLGGARVGLAHRAEGAEHLEGFWNERRKRLAVDAVSLAKGVAGLGGGHHEQRHPQQLIVKGTPVLIAAVLPELLPVVLISCVDSVGFSDAGNSCARKREPSELPRSSRGFMSYGA
jgi:hypothetical protein